MESSAILSNVPTILMILTVETLIMLHGVTSHFYFLENLMNRLLEHCTNHLRTRMPSMSRKISPESIVVISLRPKVSLVKKSHLWFPLPLLLILFNPFMLVNPIH